MISTSGDALAGVAVFVLASELFALVSLTICDRVDDLSISPVLVWWMLCRSVRIVAGRQGSARIASVRVVQMAFRQHTRASGRSSVFNFDAWSRASILMRILLMSLIQTEMIRTDMFGSENHMRQQYVTCKCHAKIGGILFFLNST